jgi:hypothetical protein
MIDIEWLRQVFECTAAIGRHCTVEIGMRRHDDHRQAGP